MTRKITPLATFAVMLFALLPVGSASASEPGTKSDPCDQQGQVVIVVGRVVANRPVSLGGEAPKRSWRDRRHCVRANQPPDPNDEPIEIVIQEPGASGGLKYGAVRVAPCEGTFRSDWEITPPVPCLGKKG